MIARSVPIFVVGGADRVTAGPLRRRFAARALVIAGALATCGSAPAPEDVPLDMLVGGRVVRDTASGTYLHQWPAIYFEGRFKGRSVRVRFDRDRTAYRLILDGKVVSELNTPAGGTVRYDGLHPGEHRIRVEKASETQNVTGRFLGFSIPEHANALPPPRHRHQIEFIGDSFTVGYGNMSTERTCSQERVFDTTNSSEAFPVLTAKHLAADYRVHAYSGKGMVRNYRGEGKTPTLPDLYRFQLFDGATPAADGGWRPRIFVVTLGINDFSTPLGPGARWASRDALRADYRQAYVDFISRLHAQYPTAAFLLVAPASAGNEIEAQVEQVARVLRTARGITRLRLMGIKSQNRGCNGHPSAAEHRQIAASLIKFINTRMPEWRTPASLMQHDPSTGSRPL